jgi:outer membrane protein TolC
MTPEERAELDRLLDLQEREALMARVPEPVPAASDTEIAELVAAAEAEHAAVRARRAHLVPDAEWIEE